MTTQILLAGFGGQGILFAGKFMAYKGLLEGRQLSWLPSYGPEMRGGTANCNVILSDEPVGSPIVTDPDVLIVMNLPSFDKYESTVVPGGMIIADSSLIEKKSERTDIKCFYVPATKMANEMGIPTLANMILAGKFIRETGAIKWEGMEDTLHHIISARHQDMFDANLKALKAGYEYEG
ncbi:MAG: 2-oxoacid:acceptor oxidoreductase family protein [Firmicutes bacterium]|nr:2-oxoacid:acceptor oxidoreductase family protein [Bacillota bacterium]